MWNYKVVMSTVDVLRWPPGLQMKMSGHLNKLIKRGCRKPKQMKDHTRRIVLGQKPYEMLYECWFSHGVTKIQTTKLSILLRFYFHDVLEQLKTNFQTNFRFKRVLGFVIEYAWISELLRDAAFTWRPRELSLRLKKWLFSRNFAI